MNNATTSNLTPEEETFLQAWLWEAGHLLQGPASRAAKEHGLSLIRVLEPVNHLSSQFQGEALNRLNQGPCPPTTWPWSGQSGEEVLRLLWERLAQSQRVIEQPVSPER
jgi:hypothetical protein